MLNSKLGPRAVVGYGVKIFLPSPPNYVTRSPGDGWAEEKRSGKNYAINCTIQGARLIWKQKWVSLIIDQPECLVCYLFLHWINSFLHCLQKKTAVLSFNQSGKIFFTYIIKKVTLLLHIQFLSAQHEHNKRLQSFPLKYICSFRRQILLHFHSLRWEHSLQVTPKISITTTPSTWTLLHIRKRETMKTDAAWKIFNQWVLAIKEGEFGEKLKKRFHSCNLSADITSARKKAPLHWRQVIWWRNSEGWDEKF